MQLAQMLEGAVVGPIPEVPQEYVLRYQEVRARAAIKIAIVREIRERLNRAVSEVRNTGSPVVAETLVLMGRRLNSDRLITAARFFVDGTHALDIPSIHALRKTLQKLDSL